MTIKTTAASAAGTYYFKLTAESGDETATSAMTTLSVARATTTISGVTTGYATCADAWNAAASATSAATVKLYSDWTADNHSFGTGAGFNNSKYLLIPSSSDITLDLNGHTIDMGYTANDTTGSYVIYDIGTFTVNDSSTEGNGQIKGGNATYAGGIWVSGGTATINGGKITGNYSTNGSGIMVYNNGILNMTGGSVTGNSNGAGVYVYKGTFNMTGGSVTGNTNGSGVNVRFYSSADGGTFNVSGTAKVYGNTDSAGAAKNVYLPSGKTINVTAALTEGANICVSTADTPTETTPVSITGSNTENYKSYFHSDAGYNVSNVVSGTDNVVKFKFAPIVTFDANGGNFDGAATKNVASANDQAVLPTTNPTWGDYTFAGWYTDKTYKTEVTADTAVTVATTVYAKWTNAGKTVRLTVLDFTATEATPAWQTGCTQAGTVWTNEAEGWSYDTSDTDTSTDGVQTKLTLSGATIDCSGMTDSLFAVKLPANAVIWLTDNTTNTVKSGSYNATEIINNMEAIATPNKTDNIAILGNGALNVTSGDITDTKSCATMAMSSVTIGDANSAPTVVAQGGNATDTNTANDINGGWSVGIDTAYVNNGSLTAKSGDAANSSTTQGGAYSYGIKYLRQHGGSVNAVASDQVSAYDTKGSCGVFDIYAFDGGSLYATGNEAAIFRTDNNTCVTKGSADYKALVDTLTDVHFGTEDHGYPIYTGSTGETMAKTVNAYFTPTITVGAQTGTKPVAGTADATGTTYKITTVNFGGSYPAFSPSVQWKSSDGTWSANAPTGVTAVFSQTTTANDTLTVKTTAATPAGSYTFKVVSAKDATDATKGNYESAETTFLVHENLAGVGYSIKDGKLTNTSAGMEYSTDSTAWTACTATETTGIAFTAGMTVTVRDKNDTSYTKDVVTVAAPATLTGSGVTYSVKDGTFTGLGTTYEWRIGASGTWSTDASGVPFTAGDVYVRAKATDTALPSGAQKLGTIAAAAAAPTVGAPTVTSSSITLPENAEWAYSSDGTTWSTTREFTNLTAATQYTYSVRTAATDSALPSNPQTVTAYTAYATPTAADYTLATGNVLTFANDYEVNTKSDFTDAAVVSGNALIAGTTYYIRHKATGSGADAIPASAAYAFSCAKATLSDFAITGTKGSAITPVENVTVTLTGDTYKDVAADMSFETNIHGLTAVVTSVGGDNKTATVTISGTPTEYADKGLTVTVPAGKLNHGAALTTDPNASATVKIQTNSAIPRTTSLDFTEATISYQDKYGTDQPSVSTASNITDSGEGWTWYAAESTGYDAKKGITTENYPAKTLILDGADIEVASGDAIKLPAGATIVVKSDSKAATSDSATAAAVDGVGALTITGSGKLTATGTDDGIGAVGDLTLTNANIDAKGTDGGIYSENNILINGGTVIAAGTGTMGSEPTGLDATNITIKGGASVTASGAYAAIYCEEGTLTLENETINTPVGGKFDADKKAVVDSTGTIATSVTIGKQSIDVPTTNSTVVVDGKTTDVGTTRTVTNADGTTATTVKIDSTKLSTQVAAADKGSNVVVNVPASTGSANTQLVLKDVENLDAKNMSLEIKTGNVTYTVAPNAIDTAQIASELGAADTSKVPLTVTVTPVKQSDVAVAKGEQVADPVKFEITATYDGKTVSVTSFGSYVSRAITVPDSVDPNKITTGIRVEDGEQVPTNVSKNADGTYTAKVNSLTNSTYAIIYNEASFADTAGKWYDEIVTEMASRTIVNGKSNSEFDGEGNITRAEFAAILVRALGIPENGTDSFSDVASTDWYYGVVGAAAQYGIVKGFDDGTFRPTANITRQEAMAMIQRAAKIAEFTGTTGDLSAFTDADSVSQWAMEAAEFNVGSGLIVGNDGQIRATDSITRAESATVILRLLQKSGLVDIRSAT